MNQATETSRVKFKADTVSGLKHEFLPFILLLDRCMLF